MNAIAVTTLATLTAGFLFQDPTRTPPSGQSPTQGQDSGATGQQPTRGQETNDSVLVTWLIVDNENEIALSRIALQKAQSAEVKQFAQQMIDDHGKMVQKLSSLAVGVNRPGVGVDTNRVDARPTEPGRRNETGGRDAKGEYPAGQVAEASARAVGTMDHERLIRDLGRKCADSHTQLLQEKSGAEFDRCYMGMQVGAHVKAVDTIEVFRNYASPTLRPALDEALPTVQQHLQHAKDLAKKTEATKTASSNK